jgi:hypothetical protein
MGTTDFDGRRDLIVKLRCQGRGVDYIAAQVGMQRDHVMRILKSEFEERFGQRQRLIEDTALELDYLKSTAMMKYEKTGDLKAGELILKTIDRKCRLFGLDQPTKVEVKIEDLTEEELVRQLELNGIKTSLQLPPATATDTSIIDAEFTVPERQ